MSYSTGWRLALVALTILLQRVDCAAPTSVCGISNDFDISTVGEFQKVADEALGSTDSTCTQEVQTAIKELKSVVHNGDVCSQKKADEIYNFHTTHLLEQQTPLPKAFQNFFVAFAFKVSETCREEPIARLLSASNQLTTFSDWAVINKYIRPGGILAEVIKEPGDNYSGGLVPPRNLVKILRDRNQPGAQNKIYLKASSIDSLKLSKSICNKRFAPLYEPEILPLVTLASAGYQYHDSKTSPARDSKANSHMMRWYRVVFLCESLRSMELIKNPEESPANLQQVEILAGEEAEALRRKSPELFQKEEKTVYDTIKNKVAPVRLHEPIFNTSDRRFAKAVANFRATPNGITKLFQKVSNLFEDAAIKRAAKRTFAKQGFKLGGTKISNLDELFKTAALYNERLDKTAPTSKQEIALRARLISGLVFVGLVISSAIVVIVFAVLKEIG